MVERGKISDLVSELERRSGNQQQQEKPNFFKENQRNIIIGIVVILVIIGLIVLKPSLSSKKQEEMDHTTSVQPQYNYIDDEETTNNSVEEEQQEVTTQEHTKQTMQPVVTMKKETAPMPKVVSVDKTPVTPVMKKDKDKMDKLSKFIADKKLNDGMVKTAPSAMKQHIKVLMVKKGKTLMQLFRENGLTNNLPDLNKMLKVNDKLNNLEPHDKIILYFNSDGNILKLTLKDGSYTLQKGIYKFK